MENLKIYFILLFILYVFILLYFYYTKFIFDSSIINLRKLQENKAYSEIKITANVNDSYINPNFSPKPYVEYNGNETILLKWNETITNCEYMFSNTKIKEIDLSNFDTSEITSMDNMFYKCRLLTDFNLINNNLSKLKSMKGMFTICPELSTVKFENIDFLELTSIKEIFIDCNHLINIRFINLNFTSLTAMEKIYNNSRSYDNLNNITFENIDMTNVLTMEKMFSDCRSLKYIKFINIKAYKLKSLEEMFFNSGLIDALFFNFNSPNLESVRRMFMKCQNLKNVKLENILENVSISKLRTMEEMFSNCNTYSLKNFSLYIITMKKMFENSLCGNAEFINIHAPKLISMEDMFIQSKINNIYFKIYAPNLKTTAGMFYNCYSSENFKLEGILENINHSRIETMENMFYGCNLGNFSL